MTKLTYVRCLAAATLFALGGMPAVAQHFTQTNLTSNNATLFPGTKPDGHLLNPWGMSRSSGSAWWISDNNADLSTLYIADGTPQTLVVSVPGGPTGTVFNGTGDFQLNGHPAAFIFATEDGTILAWNGGNAATLVASKPNGVYKGLARATLNGTNYLYAADFRHGKIDVLDTNFKYVSLSGHDQDGDRDDAQRFSLDDVAHAGFAPFNIQNIGGNLFVSFAKQDDAKHDDVPGAGLGFVAVFTPAGQLIGEFEHGSWLNAPWGLAEAPGDFGPFSHTILVGNFGSGQIAAYNSETGRFLGLFDDTAGNPISIDGLWGLSFGSDGNSGKATALYFTAGPNGESNGLFGTLTPVASDLTQGNSK